MTLPLSLTGEFSRKSSATLGSLSRVESGAKRGRLNGLQVDVLTEAYR